MKKNDHRRHIIAAKAIFLASVFLLPLGSCQPKRVENDAKKIFYINSYHAGYGSSDDVMNGIKNTLAVKDVTLKTFFMNTKRLPQTKFSHKVQEALDSIERFQPDVIIASDDNAVKYVIVPHFKNKDIPVVFCGVNWSAQNYGLPASNITGMLEVLPIEASIDTLLSYYPNASRLTVLSENSASSHKDKQYLTPLFEGKGLKVHYSFSRDMTSWKTQYDSAVKHADLIYFPTNGAISGWDKSVAISFMDSVGYKPIFTCDDFMMPYALLGLTKMAAEQGEWAAETALSILDGKNPGDIAMTSNRQVKIFINEDIVKKMRFKASKSLQNRAVAWN